MELSSRPEPPAALSSREVSVHVREAFASALETFGDGPVLVLGHFDADGLSAMAILCRALTASGRTVEPRIVGRGESPWSAEMRAELAGRRPGGLIVTDLGVRDHDILPGTPALIIDHHVPQGSAGAAEVITGHGMDPIPTSSLLAWWGAGALVQREAHEDLLWLAALGLIGDMAEGAGFAELGRAKARWGITALRDATRLINQPRRSASGDAAPALALLLKGDGPKDVTGSRYPETDQLRAAAAEVKAALESARSVPPKVVGEAALIRFSSPCQIHPLIAQQWRSRLKGQVVIAANTGYREGFVHFACRTATDHDLIAWLAEHRPPGADENYGSGHRQATGGALRYADWNAFISGLGFGPDAQVLS